MSPGIGTDFVCIIAFTRNALASNVSADIPEPRASVSGAGNGRKVSISLQLPGLVRLHDVQMQFYGLLTMARSAEPQAAGFLAVPASYGKHLGCVL